MFGWKASNYIEFKCIPKKPPTFRPLSNPRSEDCALPFNGDIQIQNNDNSCSTLTMFCRNKGKYYALTCAHVACASNPVKDFLLKNEMSKINDVVNARNIYDRNEYFYKPAKLNKKKQLNTFHCNTVSKFNSEADIMSIPVGKKEDFKQLGGDDMENIVLNLKEINEELYKATKSNEGFVEVCTSNYTKGFIIERNYCYIDKTLKKLIYKNAVKVKSKSSFLQNGDSGRLVYFKDQQNVWQPFAYAVCEIDDDESADSEKSNLCLKLDKALNLLDLNSCQYFNCDRFVR
ncbi:uncharacterized protein LOC124438615 [Xenia sp. Carnegie-2017]|uniref:uncharacterized protein LOC124438615 n=1 Tax=Xenia sp. Carnegie-2017 TaxID=2897299 RepID=UPI001F0340C3|nr:uncharacterized protein LOC124438615 [Xenia sp. Carnegie-2017]